MPLRHPSARLRRVFGPPAARWFTCPPPLGPGRAERPGERDREDRTALRQRAAAPPRYLMAERYFIGRDRAWQLDHSPATRALLRKSLRRVLAGPARRGVGGRDAHLAGVRHGPGSRLRAGRADPLDPPAGTPADAARPRRGGRGAAMSSRSQPGASMQRRSRSRANSRRSSAGREPSWTTYRHPATAPASSVVCFRGRCPQEHLRGSLAAAPSVVPGNWFEQAGPVPHRLRQAAYTAPRPWVPTAVSSPTRPVSGRMSSTRCTSSPRPRPWSMAATSRTSSRWSRTWRAPARRLGAGGQEHF